ncbi:MAG: hypothetical protein KBD76_07155 [Bacteriovorax sp.]|nr:hypothetical protein [Bacteriovorax sp.]
MPIFLNRDSMYSRTLVETIGRFRAKWVRLSDTEIENSIKDVELLVSKVQSAYGCSMNKAISECFDFMAKIRKKKISESVTSKREIEAWEMDGGSLTVRGKNI